MARKIRESNHTIREHRTILHREVLSKEERDSKRVARINKRQFIMIDDVWGLEFIPMNIIVIKKEFTKKGDPKFERLSHHATLEGAIFRLYRLMCEDSIIGESITTVTALKDELSALNQKLIKSISTIKTLERNGAEKDQQQAS